ncbi:MAG: T9SS type A sorting domain-containing protein, partial [Muribaculaceae bacterium]|nr:T9SS type A sorting domain-containing protein [Muribaculaceae bacterium]
NTKNINVSELNSGIYFLTVKANGFENTMKFIVK